MTPLLQELLSQTTEGLRQRATQLGVPVRSPWREPLVVDLLNHEEGDSVTFGTGVLEVHTEGFGFLRSPLDSFLPGDHDIYVSQAQIRRFGLRTGDAVIGHVRPPKESERYAALLRVEAVSGAAPDAARQHLPRLPAVAPDTALPLHADPVLAGLQTVAPLGMGSRGLLVGSHRGPCTLSLQRLAACIADLDHVELIVVLVGARPDEIGQWQQAGASGTGPCVVGIPFDEPASRQLAVVDLVMARAQREAERGYDAVVLLDSARRLYRAAAAESTGASRTLDGLDLAAAQRVRQVLGAARATAEEGTVTVVCSAEAAQTNASSAALLADLEDVTDWCGVLQLGALGEPVALQAGASWSRHAAALSAGLPAGSAVSMDLGTAQA